MPITKAHKLITHYYPNLKENLIDQNIFPQTIILIYDKSILMQIVKDYQGKKIKLFTGDSYYLAKLDETVITGNFGIGAPSVVNLMELYIALGVTKFLTIGYAGAITHDHSIEDIVLCSKAIPDEGVTQHYLGNVEWVEADQIPISKFLKIAEARNFNIKSAKVWSTSAIFRETIDEVNYFKEKGISVVDMEAAAVLALSKVYEVEVFVFLIISDRIINNEWEFIKGNFKMKKEKINRLIELFY